MDNENEIVVEVKQGLLKGKVRTDFRDGSYCSFQGIPYAKPPLGKLRFKAPQPPESWKGIRDATEEGNECYSRHVFLQHIVGSEDCLVLNVYTPEIFAKEIKCTLKPVMVWIHGGAFLCGSSKFELYGPDYLIREDVVIVTINYRIGVLGFLKLEDPTLDVPGNAGLKDIVSALQWIQNNIAVFCGDPNNVTIFGESAGAAAVHYLMLSPLAKGLFHKAIAQSGCALNCWAVGYNCTAELAKHLGLEGTNEKKVLEKLQEIEIEELFKAQEKLDHNFYAYKPRPVGPVIEKTYNRNKAFLTEEPIKIILSGNYNKVPLIIGYTSREGMLLEVIQEDKSNLQVTTNFEDAIPHSYNIKRGSVISKHVADKIKEFYYGSEEPTNKDMEKFHILITDSYFLEAIYRAAKLHAQTSSAPVYFYRISLETRLNFFKNLANIKAPGVCHGDDLGYLFKTMISPEIEPDTIEEKSIKKFTKLWTNFARSGNPNGRKKEEFFEDFWQPVTTDIHFLDIGRELKAGIDPESDRMKLWEDIQNHELKRCKL
ncbi:esterase [Asbolus verrucosus]|uniref:Esterase n=1 Tax=Asbolus verrucosus TaxID=1661398 RepID=A0A482W869_ASBVE|nr:esterase [Asbolus verrucosus]